MAITQSRHSENRRQGKKYFFCQKSFNISTVYRPPDLVDWEVGRKRDLEMICEEEGVVLLRQSVDRQDTTLENRILQHQTTLQETHNI